MQWVEWVVSGYAGAGVLFALAFVSVGVSRVDAAARGAPMGFRVLILPGVAALWPTMALRWWRTRDAGGGGVS